MQLLRRSTIQCGYTGFHPPPVVEFEIDPAASIDPDAVAVRLQSLHSTLGTDVRTIDIGGSEAAGSPDPMDAFASLLKRILDRLETGIFRIEKRAHPFTSAPQLVVACEHGEVVQRAGEYAASILSDAPGALEKSEVDDRLHSLIGFARRARIDPDAAAIRQAAMRRGLPVRWLDQDPFNAPDDDPAFGFGLLQIGHGIHQRRVAGPVPMPIGAPPLDVLDRHGLMHALIAAGLPVPAQDLDFPVKNRLARFERAAERIGYPVALRPDRRRPFAEWRPDAAVVGPVDDASSLALAYERAGSPRSGLWIEASPPGRTYRFIVIGGIVRAASSRRGDGALANVGVGAFSTAIVGLVEQVAKSVGLTELAGVEIAIVDPAGGIDSDNCAVTDVYPDPRLADTGGGGKDLGTASIDSLADALIETLFPAGHPARIPIVAVTGTNGKTTTVRMLAGILRQRYRRVGIAETDGAFVNDDRIDDAEASGVSGACLLLAEPDVDAVVLETARGDLLRRGTGFDACDVAVCLNVSDDHVGSDGIETVEQMARVKGRLLHRAAHAAVVNADDPRCLAMLDGIDAAHHVLVSADAREPAVDRHLHAGGRAIVDGEGSEGSEGDEIVFAQGDHRQPVLAYRQMPSTLDGRLGFNRENARHAAGAAWCLGLDVEAIRAGLSRFEPSTAMSPGRFNFFDAYPFTVMLDYAHNPAGVRGVIALVEQLEVAGRRRLVCMTVGSRHRSHIDELAPELASAFDCFDISCRPDRVDRNPEYRDGDPAENMMAHFRCRLIEAGTAPESIASHRDRADAIRSGLAAASPGDLLVVLGHVEIAIPILAAGPLATGESSNGSPRPDRS